MRIISSPDKFRETNVDVAETGSTMKRRSSLLSNTERSIVCSLSKSEKTNVIFNMLFNPTGLKFANVYVFPNPSISQSTSFWKVYCEIQKKSDILHSRTANVSSI